MTFADWMAQAGSQVADMMRFVHANAAWAPTIVFVLAFGESLAFLSLFLPFWAMLVGIGALITASGLDFWSIWIAASLGAALGDWVSYWIGKTYKREIAGWWPLSRYPAILPRGEAFFQEYGWAAIVIGRFWGPLRAAVPLAAGISGMPRLTFQLANVGSAFLWTFLLLQPGNYLARYMPGG
jgi:membrane protein DedA with SNARE-associated domain